MDEVGITNGCAMVEVPKSSSRNVTVHSAMELRCWDTGGAAVVFGEAGLVVTVVAMDEHKGSFPTCLGEKVLGEIEEVAR